jgi:hypothetical protein
MRLVLRLIAGAAIVVGSFAATNLVLDYYYPRSVNEVRTRNAKAVMAALEKHKAAKGGYPVLLDGLVGELSEPLVKGGFINALPSDPVGPQFLRYVSYDGKAYGMLVGLEGGPCLIEMGISKSGFWGQPPACPL